MLIEEIVRGKLVAIEDNSYTIEDDNGQEFPNCVNITSLKLKIGELIYLAMFEDSNMPIILGTIPSDVRDNSIEDLVNDNKNKISNLDVSNKNLQDENEKLLKILDGNKKYIQEIEKKMLNTIQHKYEIIDGYWHIDGLNTGLRASGTKVEIINGTLWLDDVDTGYIINSDNIDLSQYPTRTELENMCNQLSIQFRMENGL